jgi:hypothetical protein
MNWISAKYPVFKAAARVFLILIAWIPVYLWTHPYSMEESKVILAIAIPLVAIGFTIDLVFKHLYYRMEIREDGHQVRVKNDVFPAEDIVQSELHLKRGQSELRYLFINGQEQRIILENRFFGAGKEAVRAALVLAYRMELEEEDQSHKSMFKEVHVLSRSQLIHILSTVLDAFPSE